MNPLSPKTKRLLDLARDEDAPPAEIQARVERSLARRLALGGGALVTGAAVTKSAAGAGVLSAIGKPLAVASLALGVGAGAWQAADWVMPPAPAEKSVAERPRAGSNPSALQIAEPAPEPPTDPPMSTAAQATAKAPSGTAPLRTSPSLQRDAASGERRAVALPDELRAETEALRLSQQALRDGDAKRALSLLDDQDARHASGLLQQERAAARVMALCQAGAAAQARAEAGRFEARFPRSPLVARVRSSCREP